MGIDELIGSDLGWSSVAVPLDDPGLVVGLLERDQGQAQLLDRVGAGPQRFSFSTRMKRSAQPLPSGRTKAGELARPRKRMPTLWKWWLTYWEP